MMKCSISLLSLVAALPAVHGIVFTGPASTVTILKRGLDPALPQPTIPPPNGDLKKRQTNLNPETCGWVDGIYSSGVTCPGSRTCMLYTSAASGMAGCCDGANTIDCGWASSCIDAKLYRSEGCGTSCLLNSFIRKCTATTAPYCVTWLYPGNGIYDYGCAAYSDSSVSTIFETATDAFGATTSMNLPTVTANAVSTNVPDGSTTRKTAKKIAIGLIVGIVVAVLFVLFCIAIGIVFCIKKRRKQRQIAASNQAMAAVHATRPQPEYPLPQQHYQYLPTQQQQQAPIQTQMHQPSLFKPSTDPQSPVSATASYFAHGAHEEKPNAHPSVHEYAITPISGPSTPVPVDTQPHVASPSMSVPVVSQYKVSTEAHEVDAVSVPHMPDQAGPVHEMGNGK